MNSKKILTGLMASLMLAGTLLVPGKSLANNSTFEKIEKNNISQVMGITSSISVRDYINVNNDKVPLYCTFENKTEAISQIKIEVAELLNKIKQVYNLQELNTSNWKQYKEKANQYINEYDAVDNDNENYSKLLLFFDIYENDEQNEEIKNYNKTKRTIGIDDELAVLLPYDSEAKAVQEFNTKALNFSNSSKMLRAYNVNNAIVYANAHATNPNKSGYGYFATGDCTNFTSQILEAAGVGQAVYDSEYSGWWHKNNNGKHTYSVSWIRANTFARYMGIGMRTNNHWDFSASLQKGDFIGFDRAGDGDMDHNAFVVDRDNYAGNYNGMNYFDYKVAQHTSNYCAWASSSKNNWEALEDYTCIFARIRR